MKIFQAQMIESDGRPASIRRVSAKVQMHIGFQVLDISVSEFSEDVFFTYLANGNREVVDVNLQLYRENETVDTSYTYVGSVLAPGGRKYIFGKIED